MVTAWSMSFARFSPACFPCFYSIWGEEEDKEFLRTSGEFCASRVMPFADCTIDL